MNPLHRCVPAVLLLGLACILALPAMAAQLAGKVVAWGAGRNDFGLYPDYGQSMSPPDVNDAVDIAAGYFHTVVVRANGTVAVFGAGTVNTCKYPHFGQAIVPELSKTVVAAAAGAYNTLVVTADGTVLSWGKRALQDFEEEYDQTVTDVSMRGQHAVLLNADGTIYIAGNNEFLQCLTPNTYLSPEMTQIPPWLIAQRNIALMPGGIHGIQAVAAGENHTVVLTFDGKVYAWGANKEGQCNVPANLGRVTAIAAGGNHTVALKADGTVVAWGDNTDRQCAPPPGLADVKAIAAGGFHTLALLGNGSVAAWGRNDCGQCTVPAGLRGVVAIDAGQYHSVALVVNNAAL